MLAREQVLDILSAVQDPEYKQSLVQLQLIRDVMVKENSVSLSLIATQQEEAAVEALKEQVNAALRNAGAADVHIRVRPISDFERGEIAKRTEGAAGEGHGHTHSHAGHSHHAQPQAAPSVGILSPESGTVFIAVASGKGGVGKSTVTANLAVALARQGKKVGIVDADIYGFSIPDMMGIEERPEVVNEKIVPIERFGVKVISMGFFVEDNAPIIWRGPMLGKMLRNFFNEVNWGRLDYLLLDLPPGTGDVALDVHQMIPQSKEIIVTTPHATAAFVAARAGAMAVHTNHEILGVVENMAYYECGKCGNKEYVFGRGGGGKLAEELHTVLLGQIPLGAPDNHPSEPDFSPSVYKADSATGKLYLEMADHLIHRLS
ncbi:Mrp/NBP35 family ATP-binding protein [Paenibacillus koleovorans]|uniref:Mrp/NBP35 family ATP-binding protein n=1 Tax=Paenibacillus koleovorans TaxID=121608 RepID=UPI000FD87E90|nr:Mrp/NBP35 family ATP-binding protein [Paenibacillus koleovorans]